MALALSRLSPAAWSPGATPIGMSPLVQFGDRLLILANAPPRSSSASGLMRHDDVELLSEAPVSRLHLVVQIGRRFQIEHPEVPVVLSKGRYLIVDLDPARARALSGRGCYMVRPLTGGETIFAVRRHQGAERRERIPAIEAVLTRISRPRLEARLQRLAAFPTRYSTSGSFMEALSWVRGEFGQMGYATALQTVDVGGATTFNVIAERRGNGGGARRLYIATAHLDSVNSDDGPAAHAPGVDDNGSGCAGVLELAAVLAEADLENDARFILFGGEEQGLIGSRQYVAGLSADDRRRIAQVVSMDMIATLNGTPEPSVLIEGAAVSQGLVDGLVGAAAAYTDLTVQTSLHPFNGDHVPFIGAGIPAVLLIEGTESPNGNVHSANDTLQHVDYNLMTSIVTMHAAYAAACIGVGRGMQIRNQDARSEPGRPPASSLSRDDLIEALRSLSPQFSGTYEHEGGAHAEGRRGLTGATEPSEAALRNPIYRLDQPVYLEEQATASRAGEDAAAVRFSLRIDVDGTDPLHVVSGAVAFGAIVSGVVPVHFIGRVTQDTIRVDGRAITVTDFEFEWGRSTSRINRLEIVLTGTALAIPTASVIFIDTAQDRRYGPYVAQQRSRYFREVEIDVDREANAIDPEPISTHIHPDRPDDLPEMPMTLESVFGNAGIRITRTVDDPTPVTGAGADHRWNYSELHDSMVLHWQVFANRPQWKMWVFLAERADDDALGGVMFDGDIDEPNGVDRQGTALFTRCPFFHMPDGGYPQANPPAAEAARRELFFNLVHETGHAFNLAHSFQKHLGGAYSAPVWLPLTTNPQALSWMNYPDSATPGGGVPRNASWFYRRFRYRFDDAELLFLRHAPDRYVQMGAEAWFSHHARVARNTTDPRLQLSIRTRKTMVEHGEPVILELKLKNLSDHPVPVHGNLDPSDGLVEIAITNPKGERRPFLPFDHTRKQVVPRILEPGKESLYELADVTMGAYGFHFKEPGAYRVEASYTNVDGRTAAAILQLYVRPASSYDAVPAINELFDARIGRVLYVEGTRVHDDINSKIDWIRQRLSTAIGERNPIEAHLKTARYKPMMSPVSVLEPASNTVRTIAADPDRAVHELQPVLVDRADQTADTMGHIWYVKTVKEYADAAERSGQPAKAREACASLVALCRQRGIVQSVTSEVEKTLTSYASS